MSTSSELVKLRKTLKQQIDLRVDFCSNDVRTFVWAKVQRTYEGEPPYERGGGNFISSLAGLVVLEYLALVYLALTDQKHFWQQQDLENWTALKDKLGLSGSKLDRLGARKPVPGRARDASQAVFAFCSYLRDTNIVDLGLPADSELGRRIWGDMRNGLAHVFSPKAGGAGALRPIPRMSIEQAIHAVRQFSDRAFTEEKEGKWIVSGEILVLRDFPKLMPLIDETVQNTVDPDAIRLALAIAD